MSGKRLFKKEGESVRAVGLCVAIGAALVASGAQAAVMNYSITAASATTQETDPAYKTFTSFVESPTAGPTLDPLPQNFMLDDGQMFTFNLLNIYTDESSARQDDDPIPFPISVDLTFTQPVATTVTITGETVGDKTQFVFDQGGGRVTFDGPQFVNTGGANFKVELLDVSYNNPNFSSTSGPTHGGVVVAKITQIPSPSALTLLAVAGPVALLRRRLA